MPADASPGLTRRSLLGLSDEGFGHISSLVVRAHPDRLDAVAAGSRASASPRWR